MNLSFLIKSTPKTSHKLKCTPLAYSLRESPIYIKIQCYHIIPRYLTGMKSTQLNKSSRGNSLPMIGFLRPAISLINRSKNQVQIRLS